MFLLSPHTKVFLARQDTNLRKSFRGLLALTEAILRQEPTSGHLFVFVNKRRDVRRSRGVPAEVRTAFDH
jgi:transposase